MTLRLLALFAALPLAACVAEGEFPSLAMRPGERDRSTEEPARADVELPSDSRLRSEIAALLAQAVEGDRAFDAAYGPTAAAVAAAGAGESDSWVEAQQALSRLEATREATMRALADLDRIAMDRTGEPTSESDFAELNATIAAVERLAVNQQERMDRLISRLGGS